MTSQAATGQHAGSPAERRQHPRHPLTTGLRFLHGPTRRDFPARCANVSAGGLLMYVPPTTPVQPGQTIRLSLGAIDRPELSGLGGVPRDATIVRVERDALLKSGHLAVGVHFAAIA